MAQEAQIAPPLLHTMLSLLLHLLPLLLWLPLIPSCFTNVNALEASKSPNSIWRPLPHVLGERRDFLSTTATAAASASNYWMMAAAASGAGATELPDSSSDPKTAKMRSVISLDSHPAIPLWPTWGGGKVVPVSLDGSGLHDPFLLLAHHDHWFDPRDPLRKPFMAVGKTLGLPYIDVEGFPMHPHRGFDILTYVLDGSDGFRHRDSLGTTETKTYRGGTAQWMRTGSGVLHEEFWETLPDRRTSIELFQIWINLPAAQKFDPPVIHYVGNDTDDPWLEKEITSNQKVGGSSVHVRDIGATLEQAISKLPSSSVKARPPINIRHVKIDPGCEYVVSDVPRDDSAILYVRKGTATLPDNQEGKASTVQARQTATFAPDGDCIVIRNNSRKSQKQLDVLLLTGQALREPVVQAGPIVMNTEQELNQAYRQLSDGTFLHRDYVLRQQRQSSQQSSSS